MPPVGAYVSALRVISDRRTASPHSPSYFSDCIQVSQYASVDSSSVSASTASGTPRCEGEYVSTNGTRSPARTVNSARVVKSRLSSSTGVLSATASGPATARSCPSTRRTHGTIRP